MSKMSSSIFFTKNEYKKKNERGKKTSIKSHNKTSLLCISQQYQQSRVDLDKSYVNIYLPMHADLEKLVRTGKIPANFASRLDLFSPGRYVLHDSWGVGKVARWSIPAQKIQIDFEQKKAHTMGLKLAYKQLVSVPEKHFLVECFENADSCRKQAESKDEILTFLGMVLSRNISLREGINDVLPMQPEDLERFLSGRIVPSASWKNWWDKARTAMRDDPNFRLPTKRGEAIALRKANSAAEALLEDYSEAHTLESCVRILDQSKLDILNGEMEIVISLIKSMEDDIQKDHSEPQHVLELIIIRDDIVSILSSNADKAELLQSALEQAGISNFTTLADKLQNIDSIAIVNYIGELSSQRQQIVYKALPEALGEGWLAYATNIFLFGGAKATVSAADFIIGQGEKKQLFADILNGISRQSLGPDVLIWICREREGLAKEVVDKSKVALGSAILNAIERDSNEGGPNRALRLRNLLVDDKNLAPDLITGISEPESRPFAKGLYDSSVLADLDRNLLLANMLKVHPGLQKVVLSRTSTKEKQTTFVTHRSFAARKAEFEDLINVRIPANKHDLEITRAEGDLRENGGYQDAKATRQVLMRRAEELNRLLSQAEPTDFKDVSTDRTGMGTRVIMSTDKGEEIIYTILGAWDSIPEQLVIPYSSRQGIALSNKVVGESVRLVTQSGKNPVTMQIKSIEKADPALIFTDSQEN